ncbi:hypothetical protein JOD54_002185 [Actinokineospora baliensis]|nr:hypothetical protein [Actinokineospora baliensis]
MARLIDTVTNHAYAFVAANSKRKPKPPDAVTRPDTRARKRARGDFSALAAARISAVRKLKEGMDGERPRR